MFALLGGEKSAANRKLFRWSALHEVDGTSRTNVSREDLRVGTHMKCTWASRMSRSVYVQASGRVALEPRRAGA